MRKHSEACINAQIAATRWRVRWPKYCRRCGGRGTIHDPGYWDGRRGEGLPPSDEPCDYCQSHTVSPQQLRLKNLHGSALSISVLMDLMGIPNLAEFARCPRCFQHAVRVDTDDPEACIACDWNWGKGADDYCPEVECIGSCAEVAY
jgi:hypothetical protein